MKQNQYVHADFKFHLKYCHNLGEPNSTWGGIIIGIINHTTTPGPITFSATSRQPSKLIFSMQPYFDTAKKTITKQK